MYSEGIWTLEILHVTSWPHYGGNCDILDVFMYLQNSNVSGCYQC